MQNVISLTGLKPIFRFFANNHENNNRRACQQVEEGEEHVWDYTQQRRIYADKS